jgi:3',5'-nucleoside bisphosphate phosphatase
MKIDLHSHTHFSDGQLSPQELITRAHTMQVDVLAITDHDTVDALPQAIAFQARQKRPLHIVAGVELSTSWHNFDIHILGLQVDITDPVFTSRLQQQGAEREIRAQEMSNKLSKVGIDDVYTQAKAIAGVGQITRAHFARVLVDRQVVSDFDKAFTKYLGKGKKAHVKPQWISIAQAIEWIHAAGGQAVLAHPGHYDMTAKWLRRLVAEFSEAGGDGMEVIHSHLSPERKKLLTDLAVEHQLLGSSGSDFHYPNRWTELGKNLTLPEGLKPIWHDWNLAVNMSA